MNTAAYEKEAPSLSRDEAIAILDTPDEELEALIDREIGRASCRERV